MFCKFSFFSSTALIDHRLRLAEQTTEIIYGSERTREFEERNTKSTEGYSRLRRESQSRSDAISQCHPMYINLSDRWWTSAIITTQSLRSGCDRWMFSGLSTKDHLLDWVLCGWNWFRPSKRRVGSHCYGRPNVFSQEIICNCRRPFSVRKQRKRVCRSPWCNDGSSSMLIKYVRKHLREAEEVSTESYSFRSPEC